MVRTKKEDVKTTFGESLIKPSKEVIELSENKVLEIVSEELQKAIFESLFYGITEEQAIKYHSDLAMHRIRCYNYETKN